ncbi:MAG: hypothetical protein ACE37N_11375 [Pseudohongiellaceae bacterium]
MADRVDCGQPRADSLYNPALVVVAGRLSAAQAFNHYWGYRQVWMYWTGAISLLGGAIFLAESGLDIKYGFAWLVGVGSIFGVFDILFYTKIEEPPVAKVKEPKLKKVLMTPFLDPNFRSYISFTCFWHFAAMLGAPFISYYLLEYTGMDVPSCVDGQLFASPFPSDWVRWPTITATGRC